MRRSVRNLLGLTAVTAAVAVGVPATATAAGAATAGTVSASAATFAAYSASPDPNYRGRWGTYRSSNRLARANGTIDVRYIGEEANRVRITGKLWDLDRRTHRRGGKCAYIQFRFQNADYPHPWYRSMRSYKQCGASKSKSFAFSRHNVAKVQVRVCQIGLYSRYPTRCDRWRTLYDPYDARYA